MNETNTDFTTGIRAATTRRIPRAALRIDPYPKHQHRTTTRQKDVHRAAEWIAADMRRIGVEQRRNCLETARASGRLWRMAGSGRETRRPCWSTGITTCSLRRWRTAGAATVRAGRARRQHLRARLVRRQRQMYIHIKALESFPGNGRRQSACQSQVHDRRRGGNRLDHTCPQFIRTTRARCARMSA